MVKNAGVLAVFPGCNHSGLADPEAATWLSLMIGQPLSFISVSEEDRLKFETINQLMASDRNPEKLVDLLHGWTLEGKVLPLLHFSTLSLGRGLDLSGIGPLDETVDFSKIKAL